MNLPIRALLLDLDGVITDTAEYHYRSWKRLADEEGIPFSREDNEELRGVSRRESLNRMLKGRQIDEETAQAWMERKNSYYRESLSQITPNDLLPGVADLLAAARKAGLKLAVVSASRNAPEVIQRLGVAAQFDAIITGGHAGRAKPAPDHFLLAARELGLSPAECIGIEDAEAGVEAILAAGMVAVGLGPTERVGAAAQVFPSLEGVTVDQILYAATWYVREDRFDPKGQHHRETVFTSGNGVLSTRGAFEERFPGDRQTTMIHGLWDDVPIVYTELANAPDWTALDLWIDGQPFRMDRGQIEGYSRYLDLRTGELHRHLQWTPTGGSPVLLHFARLTDLSDPHTLAVRITITPLERPVKIRVRARIDGHVENDGILHWKDFEEWSDGDKVFLYARTRATQKEIIEGMTILADEAADLQTRTLDSPRNPGIDVEATLDPDAVWNLQKLVSLYTSRDGVDLRPSAAAKLDELRSQGIKGIRQRNSAAWRAFWDDSDVIIEGDDEAQVSLRHALFQLRIAAPENDERVSIAAKSLSGFGYRGHVFWDTEIFILPFFIYTQPRLARNLLMYRWHTIAGARRKAAAGGFEGAQYAWESAESGDEVTPRWVPGPQGEELVRIWCGDIELHITADIAYAVWQYWQVTGDDDFMQRYGAQILLETARFWESRAEPDKPGPGQFSISDVIGPDEYHDHVDNNAFTNRLAAWNLTRAAEILAWLQERAPQEASQLRAQLDLSEARLHRWQTIAQGLVILEDGETGLIEQFEGFFQRKEVDWAKYQDRTRSMQAILGIEGANEYQVLKQPDVILLLTLLQDEYGAEAWRANWDYYVPRTDHTYGSSLGPAIHAWAACVMGLPNEAYEHFMRAARADIGDVRGNAGEGIHAASAGGIWQAAVFGFGGLRIRGDSYTTNPCLPAHWQRLAFTFYLRGERHEVDLRRDEA
ncbi:MAG: beta-phosphoglucomutase [Caldilineaceae bacterium]|nr:beta-phosphoglucomutase [Caldilineaceae bacterium]